jgi:poly-beta-1,6-N-acetyl-D-glucosamine synthase
MHFLLIYAFWSATAVMLYTYLGYPTWAYLRSRFRPNPWQQAPMFPSVSIILVVHNCAELLSQKLAQFPTLNYPRDRIEFVVVSDGSTDGTNRILTQLRDPLIKSIIYPERRGKAAGLNAGIRRASGKILLFLDIRPVLESTAIQFLISNFADPQVGCAAGEVVLLDNGHDPSARVVGGLYWRYEQWIRNCEAKVDSPLGVYGGFYAVRAELASILPEATVLDDMLQPLSVVRQGYRSVLDPRARVYDVWPKNLRGEFDRKVRTLAGNFQLIQVAPWLLSCENRLRFELISHKLLRLLVPLFLTIILGTSAVMAKHSPMYAAALTAQLLLYMTAALGTKTGISIVSRIAGITRAFCMMNVAVVVGFYKFLFTPGPLWKIWIPTPSLPVDRGPRGEELKLERMLR